MRFILIVSELLVFLPLQLLRYSILFIYLFIFNMKIAFSKSISLFLYMFNTIMRVCVYALIAP